MKKIQLIIERMKGISEGNATKNFFIFFSILFHSMPKNQKENNIQQSKLLKRRIFAVKK